MAKKSNQYIARKQTYPRFPVEKLKLDVENPRLRELGIPLNASPFDILKALWERMAVEEIAMSVAYNGYFEHEPVFIEKRKSGNLVVFEGNRRLAAVKLLLSSELRRRLRATDLPAIDQIDRDRRKEISELPGILSSRREQWRYLGFKHVNGPATWSSYAKALYIAKVRNKYHVPLAEIAKQIGDYSATVQRMYHGLMVIEQAEESGVFDRQNIAKYRFFFNYLYTGLNYPGFRKFLRLKDNGRSAERPVPRTRLKQLGELCEWLYGNAEKGIDPVIASQNPDLKTLDRVLLDPRGVKALRDGLPLGIAHDISLGDEKLFRLALQEGKKSLQKAHGTLTTGYDPETGDDAFHTATSIQYLATDLVDEMAEKRKKSRRSARQIR